MTAKRTKPWIICAIPEGWTSTMVVVLLSTGAILFSLGVIAEYIGVAVNMAMGKPLYLIVSDPHDGPLGRRPLTTPFRTDAAVVDPSAAARTRRGREATS